jgi:hypothetical protein
MLRLAVVAALLVPGAAYAGGQCTDIHLEMVPTDYLQIVAWIEDGAGNYVDTVFITRKTGLYGLGNRPGRFDFNSGPPPDPSIHRDDMWPYGRRITTFPVWAHRHGYSFDKVVYRNGDENNLSHPSGQSSREGMPPYCRPMDPTLDPSTCGCMDKPMWDSGTCATTAYTDKGVFSPSGEKSLYPPRADLVPDPMYDSPSVAMYAGENPFDTVSQATPAGGTHTEIAYAAPPTLGSGNYVMLVEVSKEFDFNAAYNETTYPPPCPTCIPWSSYGQPYRGQPSVVYRVPFVVGPDETIATSLDYAGYGDPDGNDGTIRPPDATITTGTPASGAERLELVSDGATMYRLRVHSIPKQDFAAPDAPAALAAVQLDTAGGAFRFIAPGDDGQIGTVTSYEVRIRAADEMTPDNFDTSMPTGITIAPAPAGSPQTFTVSGLLPETDYWVGVRAYDDCHNASTLAILPFRTADRVYGSVDACFVATAAYGSMMANDVEVLRKFRDTVLEKSVLGELAVETYYTFGPPVARVVGASELLRATARAGLAPVITNIRSHRF